MRRDLLMIGVALLVLGVAVFFVGTYLSSGLTSSIASLVTSARREAIITPGSPVTINITSAGVTVMVIYNDTLGKPLQVFVSEPGALSIKGVEGQYLVIYAPETAPATLSLVNNYSGDITVYYAYGFISMGEVAPLALSMLISTGLAIAGIILLVLGGVLRGR